MSVLAVELDEAIATAWDAASLDDQFTTYWAAGQSAEFAVLNDQEAGPGTPMPYCVYSSEGTSVATRMTQTPDDTANRREFHNIPIEFHVHARAAGGSSAKAIATTLAEEIMKVFGGHPTSAPSTLSLTNGSILNVQFQNDFGVREGTEEYQWVVKYLCQVDVVMAA